jgi:hypothetical protein
MNVRSAVALATIVICAHGAASAKEHAMSTSSSISHLSSVMTTRTPIAAAALETYPDVEVRVSKDRATIEKAYAELEASKPTTGAQAKEYRWKLAFADASKHRLAEIYVAAFAQNGSIGGEPIASATIRSSNGCARRSRHTNSTNRHFIERPGHRPGRASRLDRHLRRPQRPRRPFQRRCVERWDALCPQIERFGEERV